MSAEKASAVPVLLGAVSRHLLRILLILFSVLAFGLGAWLCTENTVEVELVLFGTPVVPVALGVVVVSALAVGLLTGLLCNALAWAWWMLKYRRLQRRCRELEKRPRVPSERV